MAMIMPVEGRLQVKALKLSGNLEHLVAIRSMHANKAYR